MSLRAALRLLSREPAGLLVMIFLLRWLQHSAWGALPAFLLVVGYWVLVLRGALKDDLVPLPGIRFAPRAAWLGCATWMTLFLLFLLCLLVTLLPTVFFSNIDTVGLPLVDWHPAQFRHPLTWLNWAVTLWVLQCGLIAIAWHSRQTSDATERTTALQVFGRLLIRPPFSWDGIKLLAVMLIFLTSLQLFQYGHLELPALVTALPFVCGVVYAHCLGQFTRKCRGLAPRG